MSLSNHSKNMSKIYGSLKLYNENANTWVHLRTSDVGDIKYSINTDDHHNWLICDGRSLSRSNYPELFALIGTTYGNNDGSTFKIPDARGRVLGGIGSGAGLTARSAGTLLGSETHTLSVGQLPSHTHTYTIQDGAQNISAAGGGALTAADEVTATATSGSTGSGQSFNIMQPTAFLGNIFIYAKSEVTLSY
jgi:microcystin-dependent protein